MGVLDKLLGEKARKKEDAGTQQGDNDKALARAALYGKAETVCALLDAGANINARTIISSWTPLMAAASEGKTAVVQILLDRGADVNAQSPGGSTALMVAAKNGQGATLQLLLDRGADVHQRNSDGASALTAAAAFGQLQTVRLLLSRGAKDDGGALQAATHLGHKEIIELLRETRMPA
jgi:ankyrin repeat protein